jgi:hypothetical protein
MSTSVSDHGSTTGYDISRALSELGASDDLLSPSQLRALDVDGFLIIPGGLPDDETREMARRLDELHAEGGDPRSSEFTEEGTARVGALLSKDPLFDRCFLDPLVLAAVRHMVGGEFGLSSLTSRSPLPGSGRQNFHHDGPAENRCGHAIWMIDDFTVANGAMRVVPGSHALRRAPFSEHDPAWGPHLDHPRQRHVLGPAGSLVLCYPSLWHAGSLNSSGGPRRMVSAFFTERGKYQPITRTLTPAMRERYTPGALYILDHRS